MEIRKKLFELCTADGVSGDELPAARVALSMLKEFTDDCAIDKFNNVIGHFGEFRASRPTVLLDAHIDRIGFIVTYIDDNGFIKVAQCGGADRRVLAAQTVTVHATKKIKGVISVLPPHIKSGSDAPAKIDEIVIDTGYNKEELEKIVQPGDRITVDSTPAVLSDDIVTASAIDDRSGVASILYALELMKGKPLKYNVDVTFTAQEETGEAGAKTAAYNLSADMALEMDVSFAATPDSERHKCGELGKGVMIGIAPSLDRKLSDELIGLAKKNNIAYQLEVMGGTTGTNADAIGVAKGGIPACTLSIPLRYMHTPVETVCIKDIEATARLIAAFICEQSEEGGNA